MDIFLSRCHPNLGPCLCPCPQPHGTAGSSTQNMSSRACLLPPMFPDRQWEAAAGWGVGQGIYVYRREDDIQKSLCYSLRKMPKLKKQMTQARRIMVCLPAAPTPDPDCWSWLSVAYTLTSVSLRTPNGPITTP